MHLIDIHVTKSWHSGFGSHFISFRQEGALAAEAEEALLRNRLTFAVLKLEA